MKKKKFPKDPNITYVENLRKDPEFQKLYKRAYLRFGIAIEIARLREEKKITQKQLAEVLQTNQSVISRIEKGNENFSIDKLARIAEALGMRVKVDFAESPTSPRKR